MFVADKLVYLQMPKTASTHIAKALDAVVGGEQHTQHHRLKTDPEGRTVVVSVRNPWSWYVSLWAYGCRGGGGEHGLRNQLTAGPPSARDVAARSWQYPRRNRAVPIGVLRDARAERERARSTRTDLWRAAYTSPDDVAAFRRWLGLMFDAERAHELSGPPPRYGELPLRNYSGFMTFRYLTLLVDDRASFAVPGALDDLAALREFDRTHTMHDDAIRIEELESELRRVLARAGYDLSAEQDAELVRQCRKQTNVSPHLGDREYYDDEALALVAATRAVPHREVRLRTAGLTRARSSPVVTLHLAVSSGSASLITSAAVGRGAGCGGTRRPRATAGRDVATS